MELARGEPTRKGGAMKAICKPIVLDGEPDETNLIIAEIDNLIATGDARVERQRDYIRSVSSDFEAVSYQRAEASSVRLVVRSDVRTELPSAVQSSEMTIAPKPHPIRSVHFVP